MAPVTSTRSIRLKNDLWARLAAHAEKRGLTVNALVAEMVEAGLGGAKDAGVVIRRIPPQPTTWPSGAIIRPEHTEDPGLTLGVTVSLPARDKPAPARFTGTTATGEPLPPRKPYQKGGKK
jgi:hypothetical protein